MALMRNLSYAKTAALPWMIMVALLGATLLIYWPGLMGGFVYDDASFIVGNTAVHVATGQLRDWAAAAFSFPGGVRQGRWLGMLSFAANHFIGGLDPYGFKLTNLVIHLLNGWLIFLALRALFAFHHAALREAGMASAFDGSLAAVVIAGLWLVLPINLTGVLYVSQRLESLSNTFVFLGLWWYLRARIAHWRGEGGACMWISLLVCTGIGALVKESAILLPLYAACTEWTIGRGRNRGGAPSRAVAYLYGAFLVLPLILGSLWLLSWVFGPTTYARPFDTWQRLITEARVLVDYMEWTVAPSLDSLTLYHDDIQASNGLFDPPSTIAALAGLAGMMAMAFWQTKRRPLFSLGILWFVGGHLLTATVIPLLLAFEHRNYFPSLGLLLAGTSMVALEGPLRRPSIRIVLTLVLGSFYAVTTHMRAEEWSDPMRLAYSESSKRPRSALAQYDFALTLMRSAETNGRPAIDAAILALEKNRHLPGAGIAFEQALIALTTDAGQPADPDWYGSIIEKLRAGPTPVQDAKALQNLNECFAAGKCKEGLPFLDQAYAAAMSFPHPSPVLLYVHSQYAAFLKDDYAQAEKDLRASIALSPFDPATRSALATILIRSGQRSAARVELEAIKRINYFGQLDDTVAQIEAEIGK